jgi:hypothetical protein
MNIAVMLNILGIVLICALIGGFIAFTRWRNHRLLHLYDSTKQEGMIIHSACMIRDGWLECPGFALVANDTLYIHSIFKKIRTIPLSQASVTREETGRCGSSGSYAWQGKQVFHLNTPETTNLAIGVKDAERWRNVLNLRASSSTGNT